MKSPLTISDRGKLVEGPYGAIERLIEKMRREIQNEVDADIFRALAEASKSGNNDT
jgi:hypothetical protein